MSNLHKWTLNNQLKLENLAWNFGTCFDTTSLFRDKKTCQNSYPVTQTDYKQLVAIGQEDINHNLIKTEITLTLDMLGRKQTSEQKHSQCSLEQNRTVTPARIASQQLKDRFRRNEVKTGNTTTFMHF